MREDLKRYREFLKDTIRLKIDFSTTDQNRRVPPPPVQKPIREDQSPILLPTLDTFDMFRGTDLVDAMTNRLSHRAFDNAPLSAKEVAFLLWATQGIRQVLSPGCAFRTVPSAGCRHAFETYLLIRQVDSLSEGVYRYLPLDHALVLEHPVTEMSTLLNEATLGQSFVGTAPVIFAWTVVPYRMEWRYDIAAHRVIAMDVGHVCQNLYLACEAISCGTCAIAAYHQSKMDSLLKVDGEDEYTFYLAPVGKV